MKYRNYPSSYTETEAHKNQIGDFEVRSVLGNGPRIPRRAERYTSLSRAANDVAFRRSLGDTRIYLIDHATKTFVSCAMLNELRGPLGTRMNFRR